MTCLSLHRSPLCSCHLDRLPSERSKPEGQRRDRRIALWPFLRTGAACLSSACIGAVGLCLAAPAQAPDAPAAPLPSAITTAHKLFLGNAGDQENADCLRAYNDFYADLGKLPRLQLVPSPKDADLILEMHYELTPGQTAGHDDPRRFRVLIIDPGTHVVLWSLTERTNYAAFQKNRDKNLDEMVEHLASDFDALTSAQPPNNNSRTQHGLTH